MKKPTLSIAILSKDRRLADLLDSTQNSALLHFTMTVTTEPEQLPTDASVIIDTLLISPEYIIHHKKPTAKYVIISKDVDLIHKIASTFFDNIYDVWRPDDSPTILQLRFLQLIRRLEIEHNHYIASTIIDTTINSLPDLIWLKNVNGIHLKVNDAFARTVNKTKENIEGHDHFHIWDISREEYENSDYICVDTDVVVINNRKSGVFDEKVATRHGLRQFKTYKAPIFDEMGNIVATVGIAHDVTEMKNMSVMFDLTINNMPFAIMVKNMDGEIIHLNTHFTKLFDCDRSDYLHTCCDIEQIMMQQGIDFEHDYAEQKLNLIKNKENIILKIENFPIIDYFNITIGYFYMYRDITSTQLHENQLKKYAYTDTLTTLYTRRYLYEYIEQLEIKQFFYFILIDIDNFKAINDTYGHEYGDDVLIGIARIIQTNFPDFIPIRLGGDEFFILLPTNQPDQQPPEWLIKLLNDFFKNINDFAARLPQTLPFSVSAGITCGICKSPNDLHQFIIECDQALYHVKKSGKNAYRFYQ